MIIKRLLAAWLTVMTSLFATTRKVAIQSLKKLETTLSVSFYNRTAMMKSVTSFQPGDSWLNQQS
jgi:hypothetical protein